MKRVKTTIEIPDMVFRRAKTLAASKGISLKQLVTEAIEEKLNRKARGSPAWMKLAGAFGSTPAARAETQRIQKIIDQEFEQIDVEDRT